MKMTKGNKSSKTLTQLLGLTDERDPIKRFLDRAKLIADSMAVWTFIETRDDEKYEEPEEAELLEEWTAQLDDIIAEIRVIDHEFEQVTCRVNVVPPNPSWDEACRKWIQQPATIGNVPSHPAVDYVSS